MFDHKGLLVSIESQLPPATLSYVRTSAACTSMHNLLYVCQTITHISGNLLGVVHAAVGHAYVDQCYCLFVLSVKEWQSDS